MDKKGLSLMLLLTVFSLYCLTASGQTRGSRGRASTTSFRKDTDKKEERESVVRDFVMAVIAGMLRHPDPTIRKQSIQTITTAMSGNDTRGTSDNRAGARNLFGFNQQGGRTDKEGSTGVGGAVFIPDLYLLLSDPDPEVRDIASVGLDVIFQTDTTLLRFMNDADPLLRKYAMQIYAKKVLSENRRDGSRENEEKGQVSELLALRAMLVRLKHEKDPGVRKAITDALNCYIREEGYNREGGRGSGDMFGVDIELLTKYLNDENPEVRKQAIKTIALRESGDDILMKLMERLRIEKDSEVKKELLKALDEVRGRGTQQSRVPGARNP